MRPLAFVAIVVVLVRAAPSPLPEHFVFDREHDLSPAENGRLDSLFRAHEALTGNEVILVTTPTFNGRTAEGYAIAFGSAKRVGKAGRDNGVVIAFSAAERAAFISAGRGTERVLTDSMCTYFMDSLMRPRLKTDSVFAGLWTGSVAIVAFLDRPENTIK